MTHSAKGALLLAVLLSVTLAVISATANAADDLDHLHTGAGCRHGKLDRFGEADRAEAEAWDETTGRDLRNFPPDRVVDLLHMTLRLRFDDLDDRAFSAVETLRFAPIGGTTATLTLDAKGLDIGSVRDGNGDVEHFHDGEQLTLFFDPPVGLGDEHEVTIEYACTRPIAGMHFTPSSPDAPDYTPEVHSDGQPQDNSHWFVCHDFPNERLSTELIVDVPAGYVVCANGRLVSQADDGDRTVWHWLQAKPHVAYLVFMAAGMFERVELEHPRVPMTVWCQPGQAADVQRTFGVTGEIIDVFERRFGVPYPWDRYDQIIVKNFGPGGMENTSSTALYPTAVLDARAHLDRDLDALNSHELAHQWTGDLITCRSWAHLWLNEGWATYGESLWFEHRDGQDGYLDDVRANFRVARRDKTDNLVPMVSPVYGSPSEVFRRAASPYPKGASVLHMLRCLLGDEVFFAGVQAYMRRHAGGLVETSDFRYAMEAVSGRGLEWFFDQWCYRPGSPNLAVTVDYRPGTKEMVVGVEQTQKIDDRTPAFRFTLPVHAVTAAGTEVFEIEVTERTTSFRATLAAVPTQVAIDPELHVLKTIEVEKPRPMWIAQAQHGPTIAARHAAVDALGGIDAAETIDLLSDIIADEDIRYSLRRSAVAALGRYGSAEARAALLTLFDEGIAEARVRAKLVEAIGELEDEDGVADRLAAVAGSDESYATRVAAINGLAAQEAKDHADLVAELVHYESQHAQVRNAALNALAKLDDARGLDLGIQYAAYGYPDRSRPVAVRTVAKLAEHDPDRAFETLVVLLDDPERRTRSAAIRALGSTGDERAEARLEAIAETDRDPSVKRTAERALEALKKKDEGG